MEPEATSALPMLAEIAAAWGLPLTALQLDQFAVYSDELRRWNERVNLTAISDPQQIVTRHFLDSLSCAHVWGDSPASLADIGTGAGFPGVPLKILRPELQLTLVESVGKKAAFLQHIVEALELEHVQVLTMRAEDMGRSPQHRERYDVVVARAVAELRVLAEYCLPLCRLHGRFLAPKSAHVDDEVERAGHALTILGGQVREIAPVTLPDVEPRTIVVVDKIAATPKIYPRVAGVATRRPL